MVAENSAGKSYGDDQSFLTGEIDSSCEGHRPIKIEGELEYYSFSDLPENGIDGATVLLGRTPVDEDVVIDFPGETLLLKGGFSCDFGSRTGTISTINGSLTIAGGGIIVDGVSIGGGIIVDGVSIE